jgi:hypothetical protein
MARRRRVEFMEGLRPSRGAGVTIPPQALSNCGAVPPTELQTPERRTTVSHSRAFPLLAGREASVSKGWGVIAAAFLCLQLWGAPAAAEVFSIDNRVLTIEPIPGYCALDRTNDTERRFYGAVDSAIKAQARLLGYWVDCEALKSFRAGATADLNPHILVMANKKHGYVFETRLSRQELLKQTYAELKAALGSHVFLAEVNDATKTQLKKTIADFTAASQSSAQVGDTKFMGVMERDTDGIYFAQVQHITINQKETILAGVTGTTKVKRFALNATAYDVYADEQTFLTLREHAATALRALIAANPADE